MGFQNKAHQAIDFLADVYNYGMRTAIKNDADRIANNAYHLTANDSINAIGSIGQALASPLNAIGGIAHGRGVSRSLAQTYGSLSNPKIGNIAGSAFTVGVGMGVARGLTHDSAGNPDIAGIPMI